VIDNIKNLYLSKRFFLIGGGVVTLFVLSFSLSFLFPVAQTCLVVLAGMLVLDYQYLFNSRLKLSAERKTSKVLSLGSENPISLHLVNQSPYALQVLVLEELPYQVKERSISFQKNIAPKQAFTLNYKITPTTRGKYDFGKIHIFCKSKLGLIERRYSHHAEESISVYPSIRAMRMLEVNSPFHLSNSLGMKKVRRLGHSYEFDHIKNYVKGDDYHSINWKASSRTNTIMVNHYEDEKSQQVFSVLDTSRTMLMPFHGMSLLDYAINTSLVIANTAIKKHDKAGLISFSNKIGHTLSPSKDHKQLKLILEALYNQKEDNIEANYELLYTLIKKFIKRRSLLFLYTNFESKFALERVLPILRKISKLHLLVVILFENTEVMEYKNQKAENLEQVYFKTIAGKILMEKKHLAYQLKQYGIQTLITKPEDLSINTLNKYFELKSRGMI
jgi:uncharacterized protein (DUF58 family)